MWSRQSGGDQLRLLARLIPFAADTAIRGPDVDAGYRAVAAAERGEPPPAPADRGHHTELQPLAQHLRWLHEAGLTDVDCFWKRLSMALVGGYAPGPAPGR